MASKPLGEVAPTGQARPTESARVVPSVQRLEVTARDRARLLRCPAASRHAVELDDPPSIEVDGIQCREHRLDIDLPSAQLDEAIAREILDVQKEQPARVLANRRGRIASGLLIVRYVEQQAYESRIGGVEHARHFVRRLAERTHVIVVAEGDAQVTAPPADLSEQPSHALEVLGHRRLPARALVDHLEVSSPNVADELRMPRVLSQGFRFSRWIERNVPARQRHEHEALVGEQLLELAGSSAPGVERRLPQLHTVKAERGDVIDGLAVVAVPRNRGVAESDARGRRAPASPPDHSRGGTQTREKIAALHQLAFSTASIKLRLLVSTHAADTAGVPMVPSRAPGPVGGRPLPGAGLTSPRTTMPGPGS